MFECFSLGELHVYGDKKVGEEFDVEELAPSGAEVEHKLVEYFLVYSHSQQLEGIVVAQPHQNSQILLLTRERLDSHR